ncbi:PAAR domain-containing protein [Roseateles koreensis]|uniref:PAAR domain-containing protein n=1 Tax=Roseateles koreensis TaxID=2987526 RepID=A0ABT5KUR6_9BURK|nr:PAAR domain-containing protein [Roseateles koreensis]MDC8786098.1 PAAR domain-containing protein [Roseateles koreensis]
MKQAGEQIGGFRPYIVIGDRTSKGGVVFSGSPNGKWGPVGRGIARVGDRATCKCNHCKSRGYTIIVSGTPSFKVDGRNVACDGDVTDCGAVLMDAGGADFVVAMKIAAEFDPYPNKSPSSQSNEFDLHFLVKDENTGKPKVNVPYRLTLPDGQQVKGITDEMGFTSKIGAQSALTAKLEIPYYGDNTNTIDAQDGHGACGC